MAELRIERNKKQSELIGLRPLTLFQETE
jgi:hypothetical protein